MEEDGQEPRRFYLVSYKDDIPKPGKGMLIPYDKKVPALPPQRSLALEMVDHYAGLILIPLAVFLFIFTAGILGAKTYADLNVASLPQVSIINPLTSEVRPLSYGVQVSLSQPDFFADTRDAFIEEAVTFIEADLAAMQLRYFENGVLTLSVPIISKGKAGSWWQTPAGLYEVEFKKENYYSTVAHVYQPWSLGFQGNFFIHGSPQYPGGEIVPEDFSGGAIRLSDEDAERLYQVVKVHTPVLVYEKDLTVKNFTYEPKVPDISAPLYLVADVETSTILAGTDLDRVVPIASLTKLMTALVAAETINLDTSVSVYQASFVESLIPRLGDRTKVSMYSLLQLLLVESSNEAAEVIAAQVGRELFIALMNEKAKALGMNETVYADPSGLSAGNISSMSDLLRLAQYIYTNRSFIFQVTANQNLPTAYVSGEFGTLLNFNKVENLDHFIGGKVGETIAAGQTSVTLHSITINGVDRVIAIIILGSTERNHDVRALYHYVEERFGH